MKKFSRDRNALMLLALMKAHGVRKVIASPGTTNVAFVGSMQHDPWFEMYSCVDERSAAYMACGLAAESGEPVAVICTGATASRNYLPALTEAHYRKLPVLVIAGSHGEEKIGHLHSQVIDRTTPPRDTVVYSAFIQPAENRKTAWLNNVEINKALIKLRQHGGGPVLINIVASPSADLFTAGEIPRARKIEWHVLPGDLPQMPQGRVAVFVGSHVQMPQATQQAIDDFCASRNAVVFCDHSSGYQGKYRVNFTLVTSQVLFRTKLTDLDLLIHIGEVSGDTYTTGKLTPKAVWRVSPDGEIRDLFKKLRHVFEMDETSFFLHYTADARQDDSYLDACLKLYDDIYSKMPDFGSSNIRMARILSQRMPKGCVIHFGIYNSLRTWNLFRLDPSIQTSCNVGGFGIDGACSTLIGAALANPGRLHYLVVGDLAFFYDLNSLANRHVGNNIRILLLNNGRGIEFRHKAHPAFLFGNEADSYIAAGGHNGRQSPDLVRHFAGDLGFEYMTASNPSDLETVAERFLDPAIGTRPMLWEVFTTAEDEIADMDNVRHIMASTQPLSVKAKSALDKELKKIAKVGKDWVTGVL